MTGSHTPTDSRKARTRMSIEKDEHELYARIDDSATSSEPVSSSPFTTPDLREEEGSAVGTHAERSKSAQDARMDADEYERSSDAEARIGRPWSSAEASEAAKKRWKEHRERQALVTREADIANLTARQRLGLSVSKLTHDQLDAVVQRLAVDAAAGDTKAVHALARLLDQSFGHPQQEQQASDDREADEKAWHEMSAAEKAAYRAELIRRVHGHEQAADDPSDPRASDNGSASTTEVIR